MSQRKFLILSWFIAATAIAGLAALVWFAPPTNSLVVLALFLVLVAVTFASAPIWYRVQQRWSANTPRQSLPYIATRQGLWTGLFIIMILSLRILRLLDWVLVFVVLVLFIMAEVFLQQHRQLREMRKTSAKSSRPTASASSYQRTKSSTRRKKQSKK